MITQWETNTDHPQIQPQKLPQNRKLESNELIWSMKLMEGEVLTRRAKKLCRIKTAFTQWEDGSEIGDTLTTGKEK